MKSKAGHKSLGNEVRKHVDVADGAGGAPAPHFSILPWACVQGPMHLTSAFSLGHVSHLSSGVVHTQVP